MEVQLRGYTDRQPLGYRCGETMRFRFFLEDVDGRLAAVGGRLRVAWLRRGDDGVTAEGVQPIALGDVVEVPTALEKPGFVWLSAALQDAGGAPVMRSDGKPVVFDGGAGAEVERIPFSPEPPDFDDFWRRQQEVLASVPPVARVVELDPMEEAVIYTVSVDCAGPRPATAFMTIPNGAPRRSCAVHLHFDGYGFDLPKYQNQLKVAPGDGIHIYVNAHGAELMKRQEYYLALNSAVKFNGQMYAFATEENSRPEKAYFQQMAWRALRMVEFARTLPEWNGRDIVCEGISQGGLQSIWATALSPYVTELRASIPWNCDVAGTRNFGRLFGDWRLPYAPGLEYFDCVNMARRIRCKTTVARAGLGDYICPPSGVSLFYRALACEKAIRWYQGATHIVIPRFPEYFDIRG